jgi:hypothetical protein
MDGRRIRLRTFWSASLCCDLRQPATGGRRLRVPARRFHLAGSGAGGSSNRGLITEIVVFPPDGFPAFRLPMMVDTPPEMNKCH